MHLLRCVRWCSTLFILYVSLSLYAYDDVLFILRLIVITL